MSREEVTVARLLQERLLRGATVLAGDRVDATVCWSHSLHDLEHPLRDLAGVAVMADQSDLEPDAVARIEAADAAALFVFGAEPKRWEGSPGSGMAVIGVPAGTGHRELGEMTARLALAHESHVLRYAQQVHGALAQLLHRGAGISAIASRMARLSGCTVAIFGTDLRLQAFDQGPNTWLDPTSMVAALRPVYDEVAGRFDGRVEGHHASVTAPADLPDRRVTCVIAPIDLVDRRDGWVILIDAHDPPHEHDVAEHRVVVEQAATIVGTELLRMRSVERAEERARGNFVHALLHGRFSTHADLVARAAHHDFPVDGRHAVVVARSAGLIADGDASSRLAEMPRAAARVHPLPDGEQTLAAVVGDVLAVVRPVSAVPRSHRDPALDDLRAYATALEQRLGQIARRPVLVAFGRPVVGAEQIVESYREARVALDLRERLKVDHVCGFADLRVDSALLDLAQAPAGRSFADDILEPLRQERGGALLEATRTYVEAGGNLNEASRKLGVHRNTMLYKLDRVSRLLQRDIRHADTQFTIWLAMRLATLAETAERVERDLG